MAIPGRTLDRLDPRGKVKIGEKRQSKKGKDYPAAIDRFISDDPDFVRIVGEAGSNTITVTFPYATADENFSTGLERWVTAKDKSKQVLTCYTKDNGPKPVALRLTDFVRDDDEVLGAERGQNRTPILCRGDNCPLLKDKSCKPMGRLLFYVVGDNHAMPLEFDTKAWNTVERIAGALKAAERLGPLNNPERRFELHVEFVTKGANRFPVATVKETTVLVINDDDGVALADALLAGRKAFDTCTGEREALAAILDLTNVGWRDRQPFIDRIKEIGAVAALDALLQKHDV